MTILVVNDDGIDAKGIEILAGGASRFGSVWVAAPDRQCSAMSQCITLRTELPVKESDFPVKGARAFRIGGTPADCVKVAVQYLMPQKPDYVLSGINFGYNAGYDIAYSGTVGAAMEGLMNGIASMAFSTEANGVYGTVHAYLPSILEELLGKKLPANRIWNVNFPGCEAEDCKGILRDRIVAGTQLYLDRYTRRKGEDGTVYLSIDGLLHTDVGEGNDLAAVQGGYISIGTVKSMVMEDAYV